MLRHWREELANRDPAAGAALDRLVAAGCNEFNLRMMTWLIGCPREKLPKRFFPGLKRLAEELSRKTHRALNSTARPWLDGADVVPALLSALDDFIEYLNRIEKSVSRRGDPSANHFILYFQDYVQKTTGRLFDSEISIVVTAALNRSPDHPVAIRRRRERRRSKQAG